MYRKGQTQKLRIEQLKNLPRDEWSISVIEDFDRLRSSGYLSDDKKLRDTIMRLNDPDELDGFIYFFISEIIEQDIWEDNDRRHLNFYDYDFFYLILELSKCLCVSAPITMYDIKRSMNRYEKDGVIIRYERSFGWNFIRYEITRMTYEHIKNEMEDE